MQVKNPAYADEKVHKNDLDSVCCIAQEAAQVVMGFYKGAYEVSYKADESPVTQADMAANDLIVAALEQAYPDIAILSEESESHILPSGTARYWLVDPIDGTKSFVRGTDEFTVNIALIEQGVPILGVIAVPATGEVFSGGRGYGAFKQLPAKKAMPIRSSKLPDDGLRVLVSSHHRSVRSTEFAAQFHVKSRVAMASSLKFCRVAEGAADLYPRFGPTMLWDTAAGQAIVEAAGGCVTTLDGSPLRYDANHLRNPAFLVWGSAP